MIRFTFKSTENPKSFVERFNAAAIERLSKTTETDIKSAREWLRKRAGEKAVEAFDAKAK